MTEEISVCFGEVLAAKEAIVCRERRWMSRFKYEILVRVDKRGFSLGITTPQTIDDMLTALRECLNGGVSEDLPPFVLMTACAMRLNGERGVQQQHALIDPTLQMP